MILKRQHGLFSNINVLQKSLSNIYPVSKIELILTEYFAEDLDVYPLLFGQNNDIELTQADYEYIQKNCPSNHFGLFDWKVDLSVVDKLRLKYLNHVPQVIDLERKIIMKNNIPNEYFFAWYRGTDKITENNIPQFIEFIKKIEELNMELLPVVVKTDSLLFTQTVKNLGSQYINIPLVRLLPQELPIHERRLNKMSEQDFINENGITKVQYLQSLLAITTIASRAKVYLATNSNINTYVIQQRGNFDNVHVYRDDKNLLFQS